ncbi:hypothetical protein SETIT_2G297200v2 [Setaria italica]|uniref:Uncharacterized protein n=1 Tax=Setaria italica TaxID=4555 RepID=A0A368Q532_SETIT|nr:hypothetical protein SETIT_2G297200v2 [Setaria italica]
MTPPVYTVTGSQACVFLAVQCASGHARGQGASVQMIEDLGTSLLWSRSWGALLPSKANPPVILHQARWCRSRRPIGRRRWRWMPGGDGAGFFPPSDSEDFTAANKDNLGHLVFEPRALSLSHTFRFV